LKKGTKPSCTKKGRKVIQRDTTTKRGGKKKITD